MRDNRLLAVALILCVGLAVGLSACGGSTYKPGETTALACQDGEDNDSDGQIDCGDSDCAGYTFCGSGGGEQTADECTDGQDNDDDGRTDCEDPGCSGLIVCLPASEDTAADCQDGTDNDSDGDTDCDDSDCQGFVFCAGGGESSPDACQNGVDDDDDGDTDCGDPDCQGYVFCAAETEDTASACDDLVDNDGDGRIDCSDTDCQGFYFCAPASEDDAVACADGADNDRDGATDCDDVDCQGFVFCGLGESSTAACQDTADNDGDGLIDCNDPDCQGFVFCFTTDETTAFACQDGADNDGDGATDCDDTDCQGYLFCSGAAESTAAACQDGADNDSDGDVDCDDTDCQGFVFCSTDEISSAACQDGVDNDSDGATDCDDTDCEGYVFCQSWEDSTAACQDGVDNDVDGLTDCDDPECQGFVFCLIDETSSAACQDAVDNDGDGAIDCDDPDCEGYVFCHEFEDTVAACQDGTDNDGDGAADCLDPDCQGFVFCLAEETTSAACQDGQDNDNDGDVDCDDSDCLGFVFCFGSGEESSYDACADGQDNDGDGDVDCDDPGCWPWGYCQHYQGYPLVDAWGETFDGLERPARTWPEAKADCEALGGRLPTATELWRNNATSGTGDLAGTGDTNYLWTEIRNYQAGRRILVRLSDGSITNAPEGNTNRYRCVWPDSDGQGFDADRCHGDPGAGCYAFDRVWNVDARDRAPLDYVAATHECSFYGASVPTVSEWGQLIHAGLPNGTGNWNWAGQSMYWYSGNYGMAIVGWTDAVAPHWHFTNSGNQGGLSAISNNRAFRCVGLADPAGFTVPNPPACNGACQQFDLRRSTVVADDTDRVAIRLGQAMEQCRAEGADLPNAADATELIQNGWANGTNEWNWITDTMYWYPNNWGNALARWTGAGDPHYAYQSGTGGVTTSDTNRAYRCVWRQEGPALPSCQAGEVVTWDGADYACAAVTAGDSAGSANVIEIVDDFGNAWDGIQRNAAIYADALTTCEGLGGRLPTASEIYAVRASGNPHDPIGDINSTSYLWTTTQTGSAGNRAQVRVSDGASTQAGEGASTFFRCIWPATRGDVLAGANCYGPPGDECFTSGTLSADKYDRVALDVAGAINECATLGGYLPDHRQAMKLIHDAWGNGSDAWLWLANAIYWYSSNYGYSVFRWAGDGPPDWEYIYSTWGSYSVPTSFRPFRCVYDTGLR